MLDSNTTTRNNMLRLIAVAALAATCLAVNVVEDCMSGKKGRYMCIPGAPKRLEFVVLVMDTTVQAGYNCPPDAWIKFNKLDITPMPFNILGKINVDINVQTSKSIGKSVKLSVNVKKSNLNNGFIWEIPCTNIGIIGSAAQGFQGYLGSCEYSGSCDFPLIKGWVDNQSCPAFFADYAIPCTCPFPAQSIVTPSSVEFDLSLYKDKFPKWLIEGAYEVKVEMKDSNNNDKIVGCMKMRFEAKNEPDCPEVLKRLGAC